MAFDKNMEESRRNKILLIKFRKSRNSARKRTLGSSICMTLKRRIGIYSSPFFVGPPRAREKNARSWGKQFLGKGWKGGKAGSVEMHVVARVTTEEISSLVSEDLGEARRGTGWTG